MTDNLDILILSVLKPSNDIRNYHKIGKSIAKKGYKTIVSGFGNSTYFKNENLSQIPIFNTKRLDSKRIFVSIKVWKLFRLYRPKILIVTCIELMPISLVLKLLFNVSIIYDIQENYVSNVRNSILYTNLQRKLLIPFFKIINQLSHQYSDQIWLAEKCYFEELNLQKFEKKSYVLENKSNIIEVKNKIKLNFNQEIKFVFSGTISPESGIESCIFFFHKFIQKNTNASFTIIGKILSSEYLSKIMHLIEKNNHKINLITSLEPINHHEIEFVIKKSNIGFVSYEVKEHTINKAPTKLFEYMTAGLIILSQNGNHWNDIISKFNAGLIIDFNLQEIAFDCVEIFQKKQFYDTQYDVSEFAWSHNEPIIYQSIQKTLS